MHTLHRLRQHLLALLALATLLLAGCGGGGGDTTPAPPATPATGTLTGLVLASADASPLANATVSVGAQSTRSGADGRFTLAEVPAAARSVLRVAAAGHVDALLTPAVVAGQSTSVTARLVREAAAQSFAAADAAVVSAPGSTAQVSLPAAGLVVQASGAAAAGTVTASVTPIDPGADPQSMPGDYSVSDTLRIESFGAIKVTLKDASGATLNLKAGATATIRIPLASRSANPPATIPLFYFNETTGRWVEEGSATLAGTAPNQYYEGQVSHFTTWNADRAQETVYVEGCVNNAAGAPLRNVHVVSVGVDYSGSADSVTDEQGRFRVAIRRGGVARIYGEVDPNVTNTVTAGPTDTNIVLPACLVLGTAPVVPTVLRPPQSATVDAGTAVVLNVVASGTQPLRYQWQRNGVALPGATFDVLVIVPATEADAGSYTVTVSNAAGSATSAAAQLTVTPPQPPVVTLPPLPAAVVAGQSATFTVTATGSAPLRYQWQKNGEDIAGATGASHTTPATVLGDNGAQYRVRISNAAGSTTSATALLTVTAATPAAPAITSQPADATATAGASASFSVVASGFPAPQLQWRRNGVDIAGATGLSYTTPVLALADSGAVYSVVASNSQGTATSRGAVLTVLANTGTDDKVKLMRLLGLSFDFLQAAAMPTLLFSEAGDTFGSAATVCSAGSISGSFNGGALPVAGTAVPATGTLAATASGCVVDGFTTYDGTSTVVFNITGANPPQGSASATLANVRLRTSSNGVVDRDITGNGSGTLLITGSSTATSTTTGLTLSPGAGATLRNELSALVATFSGGSVGTRSTVANATGQAQSLRITYDNLAFTVAGTPYLANGFYELVFGSLTTPPTGSGEVLLTSNGVRVGRIYANAEGVFIEVDGISQPFAAPRGPHTR